ncbi:MAG: YafY family protein [Ardenticatenaceae bacterium]|nr:YafY family protein [Ardenticatenaceae bacterium]
MNRIDRLMGYLLVFHNRELVRARDLAGQFEVSERTVYRDIQALSEVGVPIAAMPGEGYRLMDGFYLPPVAFTEKEARALFLAIGLFQSLTEAGETHQAAGAALQKIQAVLPSRSLSSLMAFQAIIGFYTISRGKLDLEDGRFIKLVDAIQNRQVVRLHYHAKSTDRVTLREVEPLNLIFVDQAWIMYGYCRLRQSERNFRLERIDQLEILPEQYHPRDLVPEQHRGQMEMVIYFSAERARWVLEENPQGIVEQWWLDDGRLALRFFRGDLSHFKRWILGWGDAAEVVSPAALRDEMAAAAAGMQKNYTGG